MSRPLSGRRLTSRRRAVLLAALFATVGSAGAGCSDGSDSASKSTDAAAAVSEDCPKVEPELLVPEIVRTLNHPSDSYSQGLVMHDGELYESGGRYGESTLRVLDPATGDEQRSIDLDDDVFAEGLAVGEDGRLVQLTWKEGVAYEWDSGSLESKGEFDYDGEGWGLSTLSDGQLIMSDGSDTLVVRDPADFSVTREIPVRREGGDADLLNELEFDGEYLWVNRYTTDEILQIDVDCGTVVGVVDMSEVRDDAVAKAKQADSKIDVTNGIAHLPGTDSYFVTGKWWPSMYEVRFVPA